MHFLTSKFVTMSCLIVGAFEVIIVVKVKLCLCVLYSFADRHFQVLYEDCSAVGSRLLLWRISM